MRHPVCFLLGLLVSCAFAQENEPSAISDYVGRDVREMDADEKRAFTKLFRSVSRDENAFSDDFEFVPQTLFNFAHPEFRFFVEIAPGFLRPGFCGLRLHIFDDDWKYVRTDVFSTGYRQEIMDVSETHRKEVGADVLVIRTISAGPWETTRSGKRIGTPFFGGKHQLQFYAVVDGNLMLVRREDDQGRIIFNEYSNWSVPEIGRNYPKGTTRDLLDILRSESDAQRLALLVWLAGAHMSSEKERVKGVSQEPLESSLAHEALTSSPEFDDIVRALRKSENKWMREYARKVRIGWTGAETKTNDC